MTRPSREHAPPSSEGALPRASSPALEPLFQPVLATLVNLDFAYERERDRLKTIGADPDAKDRALKRLEERHRERRAPYLQQLARLEDRIRSGWH